MGIKDIVGKVINTSNDHTQKRLFFCLAENEVMWNKYRMRIMCLAIRLGMRSRVIFQLKTSFAIFSNSMGKPYDLNDLKEACIIYRYMRFYEKIYGIDSNFSKRMLKRNRIELQDLMKSRQIFVQKS